MNEEEEEVEGSGDGDRKDEVEEEEEDLPTVPAMVAADIRMGRDEEVDREDGGSEVMGQGKEEEPCRERRRKAHQEGTGPTAMIIIMIDFAKALSRERMLLV